MSWINQAQKEKKITIMFLTTHMSISQAEKSDNGVIYSINME